MRRRGGAEIDLDAVWRPALRHGRAVVEEEGDMIDRAGPGGTDPQRPDQDVVLGRRQDAEGRLTALGGRVRLGETLEEW